MIQRFDSLDIALEKDVFFLPHHFYSSLKDSIISREDYDAVKKLYRTLNLDKLGQLSKLYNFQDTVILAEIVEQRPNQLQKLLNSTLESVILPALLAAASTEIRVNASSPCLQEQKTFFFSRKHGATTKGIPQMEHKNKD